MFSSWGLREGVLFDRLPAEQRSQDPLLAGMSVFANMRGCPPTLAAREARVAEKSGFVPENKHRPGSAKAF